MTNFSLKYTYVIIASSLLIAILGTVAFFRTNTDLFPNSTPPQVAIITVQRGASAENISHKITEVLEKELNSISGLKRILSTSRDEVSSINAEFNYDKPIGEAVVDVQNAVSRIEANLPADIKKPMIYRITDTTKPLLTIALSPKEGSGKKLRDIRLLAENQITDALLNIEGVADVDIFGANKPEIQIKIKKRCLDANNLSAVEIVNALKEHNINYPSGYIYTTNSEYIINTFDEWQNLKEMENIPIARRSNGTLFLRDVADIVLTESEPHSLYHGNGKTAIAISVMRLKNAGTGTTIKQIKKYLPKLQSKYPDIVFELTTDQSPIIDVNIEGMRSSLIQAILLTALIIFIFMADMRAALIVSVSIPMAFFASLIILWFSPFTLNMVTLSGLIISVGMVVDASIVMLENIFRHYKEMKVPNALQATRAGANEVKLSITAGMLTTVIVLIPVMFTGGYTQQVMRPLNLMICATLVASLLAALSIVPLMAAKLLAKPAHKKNFIERFFSYSDIFIARLSDLYTWILSKALRHRVSTIILAVVLFAVSIKIVVPLIGKEMMPPMDTGISIISFSTRSDMKLSEVEKITKKIETSIQKNKDVVQISTIVGSEPGQISFGGGGKTSQSVSITTRLLPRNKRKISIWDINKKWREEFEKLPGIRDMIVTEYGATPLSTTKAPLDVIISGPDAAILDKIADEVVKRLKEVPGLIDIRRSWFFDKTKFQIMPSSIQCSTYGITPRDIAVEVKATLNGYIVGSFNLKDYLAIPIRAKYEDSTIDSPSELGDIYVPTEYGFLQIRNLATIEKQKIQPYITREKLVNTIDVTALNQTYTIGHAAAFAETALEDMELPNDYTIKVAGSMADMQASNARMIKALLIGLVLLYMLLLAMFKSFLHPVTIMAAIPLAVAGAMWGLLIFNKPMCKPAMMGIIFLGGTIVNNSILLLDFIIQARKKGINRNDAIINSVKLRIRPILMTTISTVVGLTPLIFEMAVGLERMSPLGIVAAFGLTAGTLLTLVVIPVVYSIMDDIAGFFLKQDEHPA